MAKKKGRQKFIYGLMFSDFGLLDLINIGLQLLEIVWGEKIIRLDRYSVQRCLILLNTTARLCCCIEIDDCLSNVIGYLGRYYVPI